MNMRPRGLDGKILVSSLTLHPYRKKKVLLSDDSIEIEYYED